MKKLIALLVLVVAPAIVAEESRPFKTIKEEFDRHQAILKEAGGSIYDCKLWMLTRVIDNIYTRNYNKGYEKYSEKEVALQGIDIILGWADKSYVEKFGQTWDMCEEQNHDLHRFVEDLYDNQEVNKEVIVIDQLKIYDEFNALALDKSAKANQEINKEQ